MTLVLLGVLVLVDGALCGFRAAAGRNPRLFLGGYYATSMLRGARAAVLIIGAFFVASLALRAGGGDALWASLVATAAQLVLVYGVFATLVIAALALYLVGSFDLGVLASVLVLGPFTLARPLVIVAGALWAASTSTTVAAGALSVLAGLVMANFERLLELGAPPWRGLEGDRSPGDVVEG